MTTHSLVVIGYDDWHALYKNGTLEYQGHRVEVFHLVEAAGGAPFFLREPQVDEGAWNAWTYDFAGMPEKLTDIPKEVCDINA